MKVVIRPQSEFNPEAPEVGFYDLSEAVYRAAPGCNWSNMKNIQKTPKTYRHGKDNPQDDTPALKFGRMFHTVVLEEELVEKRYTPFPETYPAKGKKKDDPPEDKKWNMNATFCKDWVKDIQAKGVECVKQSDINYAKAMRRELWLLEDARAILGNADGYEVSMFWIDEDTGIHCKAKIDIMKDGAIGDLKKVASQSGRGSGSWEAFCGVVRNYKYHGQAAFYRDGYDTVCKALGYALPETSFFRWLIVEDSPPYDTAIYTIYDHTDALSYEWFRGGRELYKYYLWQIQLCEEHDRWPSYNLGPGGCTEDMELTPPDWLTLEIK